MLKYGSYTVSEMDAFKRAIGVFFTMRFSSPKNLLSYLVLAEHIGIHAANIGKEFLDRSNGLGLEKASFMDSSALTKRRCMWSCPCLKFLDTVTFLLRCVRVDSSGKTVHYFDTQTVCNTKELDALRERWPHSQNFKFSAYEDEDMWLVSTCRYALWFVTELGPVLFGWSSMRRRFVIVAFNTATKKLCLNTISTSDHVRSMEKISDDTMGVVYTGGIVRFIKISGDVYQKMNRMPWGTKLPCHEAKNPLCTCGKSENGPQCTAVAIRGDVSFLKSINNGEAIVTFSENRDELSDTIIMWKPSDCGYNPMEIRPPTPFGYVLSVERNEKFIFMLVPQGAMHTLRVWNILENREMPWHCESCPKLHLKGHKRVNILTCGRSDVVCVCFSFDKLTTWAVVYTMGKGGRWRAYDRIRLESSEVLGFDFKITEIRGASETRCFFDVIIKYIMSDVFSEREMHYATHLEKGGYCKPDVANHSVYMEIFRRPIHEATVSRRFIPNASLQSLFSASILSGTVKNNVISFVNNGENRNTPKLICTCRGSVYQGDMTTGNLRRLFCSSPGNLLAASPNGSLMVCVSPGIESHGVSVFNRMTLYSAEEYPMSIPVRDCYTIRDPSKPWRLYVNNSMAVIVFQDNNFYILNLSVKGAPFLCKMEPINRVNYVDMKEDFCVVAVERDEPTAAAPGAVVKKKTLTTRQEIYILHPNDDTARIFNHPGWVKKGLRGLCTVSFGPEDKVVGIDYHRKLGGPNFYFGSSVANDEEDGFMIPGLLSVPKNSPPNINNIISTSWADENHFAVVCEYAFFVYRINWMKRSAEQIHGGFSDRYGFSNCIFVEGILYVVTKDLVVYKVNMKGAIEQTDGIEKTLVESSKIGT